MSKKALYVSLPCPEHPHDGDMKRLSANIRASLASGADGIFIVGPTPTLAHTYRNLRKSFPSAWIGLRFLGICPNTETARLLRVVRESQGLDAVWLNKVPGTKIDVPVPVFGGIAPLYSDSKEEASGFKDACRKAITNVDVATLFGPRINEDPGESCTASARAITRSFTSLAIAGGVCAENLHKYDRFADIFIVNSSLLVDGYISEGKVSRLAQMIHA